MGDNVVADHKHLHMLRSHSSLQLIRSHFPLYYIGEFILVPVLNTSHRSSSVGSAVIVIGDGRSGSAKGDVVKVSLSADDHSSSSGEVKE